MDRKKRKRQALMIVLIGGLIAIAGGVGVVMWNKPHKKVENVKGIAVTATDLCKAYSADETKANQQYLNKAIEVSGAISEVTKNQDGAVVVTLKGDDPDMGVQCTMRDKGVSIQSGTSATLVGFCSGNTMFDVLLTDCVIKK